MGMETKGKIDLSYLRDISAGDEELFHELIDMFISQVPEYQMQLQQELSLGEWEQLGRTAHKVKSALTMMGLNDLAMEMKVLEEQAKKGIETKSYPQSIKRFITETTEAIKELKEVKKNY